MNTERLAAFMDRIASETYPEPLTEGHTDLTRQAMDLVLKEIPEHHVYDGLQALDVGCGQGPALRLFKEKGIKAYGIALNDADVAACQAAGFSRTLKMDQNDLQFPGAAFNLVWARHVVEHSVAPLWTLTEFYRVLRPGGWLYVEVPGPDTACCHEQNQNHYSVLGARAWMWLMVKAGFGREIKNWEWQLQTQAGGDVYFGFLARKV